MDMVEFGKAGLQKKGKDLMKKVRRGLFHIEAFFAFTRGEFVEKIRELIDGFAMPRDQMIFCYDDVQFPWIGRSGFDVEKRDVNSQEQAVFILRGARPDCRSDELFDSQGVDIEFFLQINNVVRARVLEIQPGQIFIFYFFHFCFA